MTSIRIYDPADGAAPPELPPMSIGVLAAGAAELLQQAADLPQPWFIAIFDTQSRSLQFPGTQPSKRAIFQWAHRFGSETVTTHPHHDERGHFTRVTATFSYYGLTVKPYAYIPAGPARS